jgi:SOS response regulatory protein OraA/RecX
VSRFQGTTRQAFRNKMGSFLQRRGFPYDAIRDVIERLLRELDTDDYFQSEAE